MIAPEPEAVVRGYATAAVLLMLVLILFVIARLLARPPLDQAVALPEAAQLGLADPTHPIAADPATDLEETA